MYIYQGKLNWKGAAVAEDETFIVILPNGPVRVGDTAFVFFQWKTHKNHEVKDNWFQPITIDEVSKNAKGDDVFTLKHPHFSWSIASQNVYENIQVSMSDCGCSRSPPTILQRVYGTQSYGKINEAARIWIGKINWPINGCNDAYAKNQMAAFITPEGFGDDKPIVALWHWTKNGRKSNDTSIHCKSQQKQSQDKNKLKFSFKSSYDFDCVYNKHNHKLSVCMRPPRDDDFKELGNFALVAIIDRESHHFHLPDSNSNSAETEFRLPQPQPSLPHIRDPMPFPRTLFETLTHTAAFVNQAGYLAKYAEERFNALDVEFHQQKQRLDTAHGQIETLKGQKASLEEELRALEAKYSTADKERKRLERENGDLKSKNEGLEKTLKYARSEVERMEKERTLHDAIDKKHQEADERHRKNDLEDAEKRYNADVKHQKEEKERRQEYEKKLKDADDELVDAKNKLEAALSEIWLMKKEKEEHNKLDQKHHEADIEHQKDDKKEREAFEKFKAEHLAKDNAVKDQIKKHFAQHDEDEAEAAELKRQKQALQERERANDEKKNARLRAEQSLFEAL
ncbi:hard-surface inducible protein [Colletotrichum kahawae]|uniref:Hard-surface inducible protein n=1 Tax=Colletotrichum kahawae TaxID=34407 RepID=A0AAE0D5D1_COLKA|nr:hard-surface inducible protein [Colletotrichum kahawae]